MGCFNIGGFYTNQVISYGMDMVGFLCCEFDIEKVIWKKETETLHYSIPLSMPIFGKYDDYGRMEKIEDSKVVDALEKYFGYDIDDIMSDVTEFTVNKFLDGEDGGRYRQITEGRKDNKKYSFMKEEFDRYAPVYEKIRDNIPLPKDGKLKNFNLFFAFDHRALWDAFIIKDEYNEVSNEDVYIRQFTGATDVYNDFDFEKFYEKLTPIAFSINKEKSMIEDFNRFILSITSNLEFKFCPPKNCNQDRTIDQYTKLNKLLAQAYKKQE